MALRAYVTKVKRRNKAGKLVVRGYIVQYRDASGKQRKEPGVFDSEEYANDIRDQVTERLKSNRLGRGDPNAQTLVVFENWIIACAAGLANKKGKKIEDSSIETFRNSLTVFLSRYKLLRDITSQAIKEWIVDMTKKGYADWTVHRRLTDLKSFLDWCKREKLLNEWPFEGIMISSPEPIARNFTDEEVEALERAAAGDVEDELLLRFGLELGLRQEEVINADRAQDIRVFPDGTGALTIWADEAKTDSSRSVPIPPSVVRLLGPSRIGPVIPSVASESKFLYRWAHLKAKAGLLEKTSWYRKKYAWAKNSPAVCEEAHDFHKLRHTYCARFILDGGDISILKENTGHKSVDVLIRTYAHFSIERRRRIAAEQDAARTQRRVGHMLGNSIKVVDSSGTQLEHVGTDEKEETDLKNAQNHRP